MSEVLLTRVVQFAAAHRYWRPEWSAADNLRVFGPCANPHGHGHTYRLEVTVAGAVDPQTGFAVDLAVLDALLRREVTVPLDHRHLNHDVPAFAEGGLIPTTENLLLWLWPRLEAELPEGARLEHLRLREDDTLWADLHAPGPGAQPHD